MGSNLKKLKATFSSNLNLRIMKINEKILIPDQFFFLNIKILPYFDRVYKFMTDS